MTMQTRSVILLVLLLLVIPHTPADGGEFFAKAGSPSDKYIILMHPTVGNISTWLYLTSEGILPVDPEREVLGVYSKQGSYDYSQASDFVKERGLDYIRLMGIDIPLDHQFRFAGNNNSILYRAIS